jgi:hypothetical protein
MQAGNEKKLLPLIYEHSKVTAGSILARQLGCRHIFLEKRLADISNKST